MKGYASLYRDKRDSSVLIQRCERHPIGAITNIGDPVLLRESELEAKLVEETLAAVASFDSVPFDDAASKHLSSAEQRQFLRAHSCVSARLNENGTLELLPMKQVRGGYVSVETRKKHIESADDRVELYDAILRAFDAAGE